MSQRPARMTAAVRSQHPTGATSPSACSARARTSRSRARTAVRGRKILLRRSDACSGRPTPAPRAGATSRRQGGGHRKTLHARRPPNREYSTARQGGLCGSPALALGRCGLLELIRPCFRPRQDPISGGPPPGGHLVQGNPSSHQEISLMSTGWIVLGIIVILVLFAIGAYNRLVALRQR